MTHSNMPVELEEEKKQGLLTFPRNREFIAFLIQASLFFTPKDTRTLNTLTRDVLEYRDVVTRRKILESTMTGSMSCFIAQGCICGRLKT